MGEVTIETTPDTPDRADPRPSALVDSSLVPHLATITAHEKATVAFPWLFSILGSATLAFAPTVPSLIDHEDQQG
jgi:hypothetical protein